MELKSKFFKKGNPEDFNKILKRQKEQESDPKFAISDALQEYEQQLEKTAGYQNQKQLNNAQIRQDIINYVIDYGPGNLEQLKGMEFDDAKTLQQTIEKEIGEYEGLNKKGIISDEELIFIKETVGKTNEQLKKVLGLTTRLSLSFRDFKKELKPLKLARRIGLTNIPIIGKKIERAIESEERAESNALSLKRRLRTKQAKQEFKTGGESRVQRPVEDREELVKEATSAVLGQPEKTPGLSKEQIIEEERESDQQFETSSGLLEKILIAQEETNEILLGKGNKMTGGNEFGILDYLGIKSLLKGPTGLIAKITAATAGLSTLGLSAIAAGGILGGITLGKIIEYFFGGRKDNPNELNQIKESSQFGTMDETNLDVGDEFEKRKLAIMKDEFDKYKSALGEMTFEEFVEGRKAAKVGKYIEGGKNDKAGNEESMKNIGKIKLYNENPDKFEIMYPDKPWYSKFTSGLFTGSTEDLKNMYSGQSAAMGLTDGSYLPKIEKVTELKAKEIEKITVEGGPPSVIMQKGGDSITTNNTYETNTSSIGSEMTDRRFFHDIG